MAQYQFSLQSSNIAQSLISLGYITSALLSWFSIRVDSWLLLSAIVVFVFCFDGERRENTEIVACNENGVALNQQGKPVQLHPPMIITPWLITVRIGLLPDASAKAAPIIWCRLWRDQLSAADWARIRRIGLTLNAPLRRR